MSVKRRIQKYTIRVTRTFEEEYVDIDVRASSPAEAVAEALKEAKANACMYFGSAGEPDYSGEFYDNDEREKQYPFS